MGKHKQLWTSEPNNEMQITCHTHKVKPILTDYIYHQNEKSKPREMDLPLLENDITKILKL
jgi:hypothetical protein